MPVCLWVKLERPIHDKQVLMMTVMEFQACHPPAIRHTVHGSRCYIPIIEITHEADLSGFRCIAEEIHMMRCPACEISRCFKQGGFGPRGCGCVIHSIFVFSCLFWACHGLAIMLFTLHLQ